MQEANVKEKINYAIATVLFHVAAADSQVLFVYTMFRLAFNDRRAYVGFAPLKLRVLHAIFDFC